MIDSNAQIHNDPDLQRHQTNCNLHNIHQTKAGSFYVHRFWSLMHWPHVWMFPAHKVGHTLGIPFISGWTPTKEEQWPMQRTQSHGLGSHIYGPQQFEMRASSTNTGGCITGKKNTTRITQQPSITLNNFWKNQTRDFTSRFEILPLPWNRWPFT